MRISDWSSDVCSSDLITMRGFARCDRANFAMSRIAQYACLQFFDGRRRALQILGEAVAREQERAGHVQRTIAWDGDIDDFRSEEHTSELQSLMRSSYAVFCLKKKKTHTD